MGRYSHPSYHLTDEQLDRFDDTGLNDPPPSWSTPVTAAEWQAEIEATEARMETVRASWTPDLRRKTA